MLVRAADHQSAIVPGEVVTRAEEGGQGDGIDQLAAFQPDDHTLIRVGLGQHLLEAVDVREAELTTDSDHAISRGSNFPPSGFEIGQWSGRPSETVPRRTARNRRLRPPRRKWIGILPHLLIVRPVAAPGVGIAYATEPQKLTVRDADGKRSVGTDDEGVYLPLKAERAKAPAHFKVEDDGAGLVGLFARVETRCTAAGTAVPYLAKVAVKRAHIAPDGSVTAELHTKSATPATITLVGDLNDRQFSGELSTSFLNCSGLRQLELDLGGLPQKSEEEPAKP
jgi:hypothetical protein